MFFSLHCTDVYNAIITKQNHAISLEKYYFFKFFYYAIVWRATEGDERQSGQHRQIFDFDSTFSARMKLHFILPCLLNSIYEYMIMMMTILFLRSIVIPIETHQKLDAHNLEFYRECKNILNSFFNIAVLTMYTMQKSKCTTEIKMYIAFMRHKA